MSEVPTTVTHSQMKTAVEALGLPAALVRSVSISADHGVTAYLHVRDKHGRLVAHGNNPLTATVHIPIGPEGDTNATP